MKRMRSLFSSLSVILLVVFITIFSACNTGGDSDVSVTGVTLNKSETSLLAGATETLTATVLPDNATNQDVSWSSSDSAVATVSAEGVVTAVAAGTAIITVTTDDGDFTAGCETVVNTGSSDPPGDPVVYVAGYYLDSAGGDHKVAAYWKDGVLQADLYNVAGHSAEALSVFSDGTDVFIVGYYNDGTSTNACYWKNGQAAVALPEQGAGNSKALSVFMENGIAYIAGYHTDTNEYACYWTVDTSNNDTISRVDFENTTEIKAEDIFRSGGIVYVVGYYVSSGESIPCFWEGGVRYDLERDGNTGHGFAKSISVSNGVKYIGGYQNNKSCYWTGSTTAPSKNDLYTANTAHGFGITLQGTDVYVAGRYWDGVFKSCYWKDDGSVTTVDMVQDASANAQAYSIDLSGNDVYVSGYDTVGGFSNASYWTVTEKITLHSTSASIAYDIFIDE